MEAHEESDVYRQSLAQELRRCGLTVENAPAGLTVSNPQAPQLREKVVCRQTTGGAWHWWWPWRQPIGPVDDL